MVLGSAVGWTLSWHRLHTRGTDECAKNQGALGFQCLQGPLRAGYGQDAARFKRSTHMMHDLNALETALKEMKDGPCMQPTLAFKPTPTRPLRCKYSSILQSTVVCVNHGTVDFDDIRDVVSILAPC